MEKRNVKLGKLVVASFGFWFALFPFVFAEGALATEQTDYRRITDTLANLTRIVPEQETSHWLATARVVGSMGKVSTALSSGEFIKQVTRLTDAKTTVAELLSVELAGTAAAARIERTDASGRQVTIFSTLTKQASDWKITGAVYDVRSSTTTWQDYLAVQETLDIYADSFRIGQGSRLRPRWMEHARVLGVLHGTVVDRSRDQFCQLVTAVKAQPDFSSLTAGIHVSGPAAYARVEIKDWKGTPYTDFLLLYREDRVWKISAKVFDAHDQALR